ncbi:MAG: nucleoside deaminase [Muribaculaceae bacterium]|nr:nucleoside deaminase [Muribaculaceae bacterium]
MLFETSGERDERFMRMALREAQAAMDEDEIPVGAVIVHQGAVVAYGHNMTERLSDVTAHAEMIAITAATQTLGGKYLQECTLYVTVEPCMMCAGALGWAQVGRVVYGASDAKRGYTTLTAPSGAASPLHPKAEVCGGVLEDECRELMQQFFRKRR